MTPVVIPHESVNDESVTLVSWQVVNGAWVKEGQPIASVETSKAVMDINAVTEGFVELLFNPGDDIAVGGTLCRIHDEVGPCFSEEGKVRVKTDGVVSTASGSATYPASLPEKNTPARPQAASLNLAETAADATSINPNNDAKTPRFSKNALELLKRHRLDPGLFAGRGLVRTIDMLDTISGVGSDPPSLDIPPTSANADYSEPPGEVASTGAPVRSENLSKRKQSEVR